MKKGVVPGIVLIAAGIYFLLEQVAVLPDGAGLALVGVFLLVLRCVRGGYGYTIGGCIALAVGAAQMLGDTVFFFAEPWRDAIPLFVLAAGFLAIYVIERRRNIIWPLIPALCLACAGALFATGGDPRLYTYWPVLLIFVGVATLAGAFGRKRVKYQGPDTPPPAPPQEEQEEREKEAQE